MTEAREKELVKLASSAFARGYTESQVVVYIQAAPDVTSEDQAIALVNQAD